MTTTTITVDNGKYTVLHEHGMNLRALRYGEPWRDLTGNGLILALVQEIEQLKSSQSTKRPRTRFVCSVCGEDQFNTPSGTCCKNGHGGAESELLTS